MHLLLSLFTVNHKPAMQGEEEIISNINMHGTLKDEAMQHFQS